MKFILVLITFLSLSAYANFIQLESGNFEVRPVDRYGREQICTFEIENIFAQNMLILNVNDCPPSLSNVRFYNGVNTNNYISEKIDAQTSTRGGYKFYEIQPISSTQFMMISHRVYENGQSDKPRSIIATKR